MPQSAPRMCGRPGCGNTTTRGAYCVQCSESEEQKRQMLVDQHRPDATQRGYNRRWKRYRVVYLARHPLCCNSLGRHRADEVVPSTDVDHITPHKGDTKLFWDPENHQALCHPCHSYKTSVEEGGRAHTTRPALPPPSGVHGVT